MLDTDSLGSDNEIEATEEREDTSASGDLFQTYLCTMCDVTLGPGLQCSWLQLAKVGAK